MSTASSTSNTISGAIKWTGLASGTDFKSVVEQLVAIEQRTITRQQTWQSQWQEKLTAINNLDSRLTSLKLNAQDYNTRDKLLSRAATSSKEDVATITNTSTAATGVYSVAVGENVVEKVGSKSYNAALGIGGGVLKDASGNLLDQNKKLIGTSDHTDANVLKAIAAKVGQTSVTYDSGTQNYLGADGTTVVARFDSGTDKILVSDGLTDGAEIAALVADNNATGRSEYVLTANGHTIPTADANPAAIYHPPLTITMGAKTLVLDYDPSGTADDTSVGLYHENMTMADLAKVINNTVASDPTAMPNIKAEVIYDKTRGSDTHSRLVLTGGEGGQANHIAVSDPTDLCLDRNSIDAPVTSSWVGSRAIPSVDESSNYTGHTNKKITVAVTNFKGNAELGVDDIEFTWADTEGNSGKFIVRSSDWDEATDKLKNPIELLQGVKISLAGMSGPNYLRKTEAFTIDCQAPVMQKAADIGLAQTDKWVHQGVADMTSPVNKTAGGKFVYTYAGKEYTVNIASEVGLSGLVEKINTDSKNPGVIASILNDGMGTATSYKLVLTGAREGAENAITISDKTSLSQMPCGAGTWTHAREASNSMSRIDGYPNDGSSWIQRPTNEVGDVLPGVVINLEGPGESQITIKNNVSDMVKKIKELVESVNFCKSYIKEQTKWGEGKLVSKVLKDGTFTRETEGGKSASGVMIGNYGFQISQSNIDRLMTKEIFTREEYIKALDPEGVKQAKYPIRVDNEEKDGPSQEGLYRAYLDRNGLVYTRLSDIGIASNPEQSGQYIIENSKLTEALTKNPEAVIKLFTFQPDDTEITKFQRFTDEDLRPRIGGFAVNMGFAMNDLTRNSDDYDKNGNLVEKAKGITVVLAENYANIISGIDVKIARETRRVEMVRTRLEEKFSRLETLLSTLNNQSTSIQAQVDKLNNNSSK